MQEVIETENKINNLTKNFQKEVDGILKMVVENKCKIYRELEMIKFFENLMTTNQLMCELKCKITQMRYDLYEMKNKKDSTKDKDAERDKIILLVYRYEEKFEELKKNVFKELKSICDKGDKLKFTKDEMAAWTEISNFIHQIVERMDL